MFKYFIRYVYVRQNRICHEGSIFSSWSVSGDPYRDLYDEFNLLLYYLYVNSICGSIVFVFVFVFVYIWLHAAFKILSYTHAACIHELCTVKRGNFEQLQCMNCTVKFSNNVDTRIGQPCIPVLWNVNCEEFIRSKIHCNSFIKYIAIAL